ncbi:hypothetical protein BBP40_011391 [Aspergillus hancockii]|nr:hypothetical protein BBP40_011391 [Aspergillus hancockii]
MKFATLFLSFLTAASASVHTRAADGRVKTAPYNYTAAGGPLNWYGLDPESNSACAKGTHQSPIVIQTDNIEYATPGSLRLNIPRADNVKFENLGATLEVVLTNGWLIIDRSEYRLKQFHFHTPSEHRVNDEYFPMEVHFVFQSFGQQSAVLGFLFQLSEFGYSMPLFDSVFAHIDNISKPGTYTKTGNLDFAYLTSHLANHGIYKYTGSLTTPPCREGVSWYLSTEPLPLNVQTYNKVKKVLKYNARYTQNSLAQDNLLELAAKKLCQAADVEGSQHGTRYQKTLQDL